MKRAGTMLKVGGLAVLAVLVAAGAVHAAGGGGSLSHEKVMDLVWRVMNFVVLVVVLVKFLSKPLAHGLTSRRQQIMDQLEDLSERREEVEKSYKECEGRLSRIDEEVKGILETARKQAELEKARIVADAARSAEDIRRKAELAVQHETAMARHTLRAEVADQAMTMAAELIRKNLTPADQTKLIEEYLERVGASR